MENQQSCSSSMKNVIFTVIIVALTALDTQLVGIDSQSLDEKLNDYHLKNYTHSEESRKDTEDQANKIVQNMEYHKWWSVSEESSADKYGERGTGNTSQVAKPLPPAPRYMRIHNNKIEKWPFIDITPSLKQQLRHHHHHLKDDDRCNITKRFERKINYNIFSRLK